MPAAGPHSSRSSLVFASPRWRRKTSRRLSHTHIRRVAATHQMASPCWPAPLGRPRTGRRPPGARPAGSLLRRDRRLLTGAWPAWRSQQLAPSAHHRSCKSSLGSRVACYCCLPAGLSLFAWRSCFWRPLEVSGRAVSLASRVGDHKRAAHCLSSWLSSSCCVCAVRVSVSRRRHIEPSGPARAGGSRQRRPRRLAGGGESAVAPRRQPLP
jgi:hypothetical protein